MATDHREDWSPWLARAARAVRKDPRVGEIKWVPYNDYSLPPVAEQVVEQVVVAEQVGVAEAAVAAKYTQRCRGTSDGRVTTRNVSVPDGAEPLIIQEGGEPARKDDRPAESQEGGSPKASTTEKGAR